MKGSCFPLILGTTSLACLSRQQSFERIENYWFFAWNKKPKKSRGPAWPGLSHNREARRRRTRTQPTYQSHTDERTVTSRKTNRIERGGKEQRKSWKCTTTMICRIGFERDYDREGEERWGYVEEEGGWVCVCFFGGPVWQDSQCTATQRNATQWMVFCVFGLVLSSFFLFSFGLVCIICSCCCCCCLRLLASLMTYCLVEEKERERLTAQMRRRVDGKKKMVKKNIDCYCCCCLHRVRLG